jgi:hypothetical protein
MPPASCGVVSALFPPPFFFWQRSSLLISASVGMENRGTDFEENLRKAGLTDELEGKEWFFFI